MSKLCIIILKLLLVQSAVGVKPVKNFKWFEPNGTEVISPISPVMANKVTGSLGQVNETETVAKNTTTIKIDLKSGDDGDLSSNHCRCVSRNYCQTESRIRQRAINSALCHQGEVMCCQSPNPGCGVVENFPFFRPFPAFGETQYGEFPWTALILDAREDIIYGTGIVVSPSLVLTTARNIQHVTRGRTMRVRLGEWDLATDTEPFPAQEFYVLEAISHKAFNPKTFQNDIAVLRLNTSIDFSSLPAIRSACLARSGDDLKFINSRCFTAGWGSKSDTRVVTGKNFLKKVDLKIHDAPVCERAIRRGVENPDYHWDDLSFICAGGEEGKGLCRGDEGAALVCRENLPGSRYTIVGMSSWGTTCGQGGFPGVFTNIPNFYKWIQQLDNKL